MNITPGKAAALNIIYLKVMYPIHYLTPPLVYTRMARLSLCKTPTRIGAWPNFQKACIRMRTMPNFQNVPGAIKTYTTPKPVIWYQKTNKATGAKDTILYNMSMVLRRAMARNIPGMFRRICPDYLN